MTIFLNAPQRFLQSLFESALEGYCLADGLHLQGEFIAYAPLNFSKSLRDTLESV